MCASTATASGTVVRRRDGALGVGGDRLGRRGGVFDARGGPRVPGSLGAPTAQGSAAVGVHLFSMLGIPVSTSQAVVGAVIGVGLTKGFRAVKAKKIGEIAAGWVVTPLCAAAFSCLTYRLLLSMFN